MRVQTEPESGSVTRIAIDWDQDGAYALVTRPGEAAERIPLSHRDAVRLMVEAGQVVLVKGSRRKYNARAEDYTEVQPNYLDQIEG